MADNKPPDTLPADFFSKPITINPQQSYAPKPPDTLPADFNFNSQPVPPPQAHPLSDLGSAFWEGIGGKAVMDMLGGASRDPVRSKKALDTFKGILSGVVNEPARVVGELAQTGDRMIHLDLPGVAYHAAGAVPVLGAGAQQPALDFSNGHYATGFGHAMALLAPFVAPEAAGALKKAVQPVTSRISNAGQVKLPAQLQAEADAATTRAANTADAANLASQQSGEAMTRTAETRTAAIKGKAQTGATANADSLRQNLKNTPWGSMDDVEEAAQAGDAHAQQVREQIANAGEDPDRIHQASVNLSDFRTAQVARDLYDKVQDLAENKYKLGAVPLDSTRAAMARASAEAQFGIKNRPVLGVLKDVQDALTPKSAEIPGTPASTVLDASGQPMRPAVPATQGQGWPTNTYSMMRKLSDQLGERIRMNSTGDNAIIGPEGIGQMQMVKSAIDKDLSSFVQQSGVPELQKAGTAADEFYRQARVPFKDINLARASVTTEPDQIFRQFIQQGKGDRAQKFYDALDPKGRASVQYQMAADALNKSLNPADGSFSPKTYLTTLDKLGDSYGVFFKGPDSWRVQGLKNLMQEALRADGEEAAVEALAKSKSAEIAGVGKANVAQTEAAGKQAVAAVESRIGGINKQAQGVAAGAALGAGGLAAVGLHAPALGLGAVGGLAGLTRVLMMTDAGQRFLLASSSLKPGLPLMRNLLQDVIQKLPVIAAQQAARASEQQPQQQ